MERSESAGRGAKLIYLMATSLDGYVADPQGKFDWAEPDVQVHTFIDDLVRPFAAPISTAGGFTTGSGQSSDRVAAVC